MQNHYYEAKIVKEIKEHIHRLMLMPNDGFSPLREAEWLRDCLKRNEDENKSTSLRNGDRREQ